MARFESFVLLAEMRTGSNLVEAALNRLPGVTCHGEAFNPVMIGYPGTSALLGLTLQERDSDPFALWARIVAADGLNGCRYFHDHDPRMLDALLFDRSCAKIVLTRNPAESYVSLQIARATGQWKLRDARNREAARARFDPQDFEDHLGMLQGFQLRILRALQISGQTAFYLDYEDAQDLGVLNGLAAWLGVEGRLDSLPDTLVPQNPEALEEKVENFADMEASLARLDRFNLSRTPNFEPRRGPNVPGFVAAADAGLLYMPIRPGLDAALRDWLASLGGGGLAESFSQKTLRQWRRAHPGHRSFTVLRHPLLRAFLAFETFAANPAMTDQRQVLGKHYGIDIPDGQVPASTTDHGTAFLAFLRWLKQNLNTQTSLPVNPLWASQSVALQGLAQISPPDLIAREDRLARDLDHLAQAAGVTAPPFSAEPDPAARRLADIWTPEMESAARETYARDFIQFGFTDWQAQAT
ncbi:nodulation protein NodH [Pontitalea aquivivens]|uniref:nodulation protein NodH n=1 Tax=Pontitalea aquivivens TaxID=3388663 RepID=UPI0039705ADA